MCSVFVHHCEDITVLKFDLALSLIITDYSTVGSSQETTYNALFLEHIIHINVLLVIIYYNREDFLCNKDLSFVLIHINTASLVL